LCNYGYTTAAVLPTHTTQNNHLALGLEYGDFADKRLEPLSLLFESLCWASAPIAQHIAICYAIATTGLLQKEN
jgi:hypothetical protein